jgi:hypothetical protein
MAIALLSASGGTGTQSGGDTTIEDVDLGTGSDRVLLVFIGTGGAGTGANHFNSATAGGQAMTMHTNGLSTGSGYGFVLFYLGGASLPTGVNDIVINEDGIATGRHVYAIYNGVDSSSPVDAVANYEETTASPSTSVSAATGNLAVLIGAARGVTPFTEGSGVTQDFEGAFFGSSEAWGVWSKAGAGGATTINGTLSGAAEWTSVVLEVNATPSSGSGGGNSRRMLMGVG